MRAACLLVLCAWPVHADETAVSDMPPRPVVSEHVSLQSGQQRGYVGTVVPAVEVDLAFPFMGTIAERPVETGELVKQGDLLARLDPEDLDADLRAAEAGVTVADAQLRSATDAQSRATVLQSRGVGSGTQLDDAERALSAAKARSVQGKAALARAADIRNLADLKAPRDGVITQVFAESGASLPAGQPILSLAATDKREVVMDLSETDVAALDIGAVFVAVLAANAAISAEAVLDSIDPVADRSTRTRRLHLTLTSPPDGFRLGALVRVNAAAGPDAGMAINADAVLQNDGEPAVWVVDRATNTVALTPVQLGDTSGSLVRVLAGLKPDDEVVIKGVHSLTEGQVVGPSEAP